MRLSVYFGDAVTVGPRPAADVLIERFAEHGVTCALLHGSEGYGSHRRLHAERLPDISTDLPLLALAVDVEVALEDVMPRGLVTVEQPGPAAGAAELTAFCGRDYRAVVRVLREAGATGATVLAGVDGVLDGRRRRERLFHSGGALTRRLRQADAAGSTTLLGEWGFSGHERPYGDRLGRIASHRPTVTVYIDRAESVAENWPIIDELTAEHGTVTCSPVPVYRPIGPRLGSSP